MVWLRAPRVVSQGNSGATRPHRPKPPPPSFLRPPPSPLLRRAVAVSSCGAEKGPRSSSRSPLPLFPSTTSSSIFICKDGRRWARITRSELPGPGSSTSPPRSGVPGAIAGQPSSPCARTGRQLQRLDPRLPGPDPALSDATPWLGDEDPAVAWAVMQEASAVSTRGSGDREAASPGGQAALWVRRPVAKRPAGLTCTSPRRPDAAATVGRLRGCP